MSSRFAVGEVQLVLDPALRVLGKHRRELADPVVATKAGEQGDGGVDHALGLGDHDGAAAEAGEPVPLAARTTGRHPLRLRHYAFRAVAVDRLLGAEGHVEARRRHGG
jgi:hypothetical protein